MYISLKKINRMKYLYFFPRRVYPSQIILPKKINKNVFILPKLIFCYTALSTPLLLTTTHPLHRLRKSHGFLLLRFPSTNPRRQPSTTSRRSYVLLEIQIQVFFLLLFCFSNLGYTIHSHMLVNCV